VAPTFSACLVILSNGLDHRHRKPVCNPERKDPQLGETLAEERPVMDIHDRADWTEMDIEDLNVGLPCRTGLSSE